MSVNLFNYTPGTGTTIVFLHGWGMDSRIFQPFVSDRPTVLCDIGNPASLCNDLADLIEKRHLGQFELVGFSMGACLSVDFTNRFPDQVSSLTLLALGTSYDTHTLNDIRKHITQNSQAYLRSFYASCFASPQAFSSFYASYGKAMSQTVTLDSLLNGLDYLEAVSITSQDIPKSSPLTLFHGDADAIAPLSSVQELIQDDHLQIIPKGGHFILNSDAVSAVIPKSD